MREVEGKRVTVVGLARSGVGAANLLAELGAVVIITDVKREDEVGMYIRKLNPSVRVVLGSHPEEIFVHADMVVLSPGVPSDLPQVMRAREMGIPLIGEIELAYQIASRRVTLPRCPSLIREGKGGFLAVTGTNGKSTTTALLHAMMQRSGWETILGGNIGSALTGEILDAVRHRQSVDFIVAEISSFQLETIREFKPRGAAIINITPDHLDRYHTMAAYKDAKARIFANQTGEDFLVLNYDDPVTMDLYRERFTRRCRSTPGVFFFSRREPVKGIYVRDGLLFCDFRDAEGVSRQFPLLAAEEIRIKGVHNLENAMAASAMALLAGCGIESVQESLREFAGLEHRLEFVRDIDGIRFFNDSKGTNVGAVVKSLESFPNPIILIAGGRDKSGDFRQLREVVSARVKALVLIGEAKDKIKRALGDVAETVMAEDLKQAVYLSREMARHGDVVLLSPGCASFDMFANFEDRGKQFKNIVRELT